MPEDDVEDDDEDEDEEDEEDELADVWLPPELPSLHPKSRLQLIPHINVNHLFIVKILKAGLILQAAIVVIFQFLNVSDRLMKRRRSQPAVAPWTADVRGVYTTGRGM